MRVSTFALPPATTLTVSDTAADPKVTSIGTTCVAASATVRS
jgi:hypothetical protein